MILSEIQFISSVFNLKIHNLVNIKRNNYNNFRLTKINLNQKFV